MTLPLSSTLLLSLKVVTREVIQIFEVLVCNHLCCSKHHFLCGSLSTLWSNLDAFVDQILLIKAHEFLLGLSILVCCFLTACLHCFHISNLLLVKLINYNYYCAKNTLSLNNHSLSLCSAHSIVNSPQNHVSNH